MSDYSSAFTHCETGNLYSLKSLIDHVDAQRLGEIKDKHRASLLHYAARHGQTDILQYLIEHKKMDANLKSENGATAAHDASVCDRLEALEYLFHQTELKSNVRDERGDSPLHLAAWYGSYPSLKFMLEDQRADAHIRSYDGSFPLHYASSHGHSECVKLLLKVAPDTVNGQTIAGLTPLYLACHMNHLEVIKILISRGANIRLKDEDGLNCLHAACRNATTEVVGWLLEKQNANVNDCDYSNYTPLHYAASSQHESLITYLLNRGARIQAASNGNTPLHVAAEYGRNGSCALLIEAGCSPLDQNVQHLKPSDLAQQNGFTDLSNELKLRERSLIHKALPGSNITSVTSVNDSVTQHPKTSVVRLVVRKKNVKRADVSLQVSENEIVNEIRQQSSTPSVENDTNRRRTRPFAQELQAKVLEHEANSRREPNNSDINQNFNSSHDSSQLLHSLNSINQRNQAGKTRAKLPHDVYGPWMKNLDPDTFKEQLNTVHAGLRKVRRNSLVQQEKYNSDDVHVSSAENEYTLVDTSNSENNDNTPVIEESIRGKEFLNNQNKLTSKTESFQSKSGQNTINSGPKHNQFTGDKTNITMPQWQKELIERKKGIKA
ncbi:unnamed protein product [Didymodactylos carnosus]|uniref:Uncharacterized protein n=1 Tax=Didymodactylos carnosus TaxID=1234261 RepID=A0A814UX19_9BILA|nr:unnamed protein product [Didymodactylos carnosus]CAF1179601.1 unnamed protein product [Didymodactylos carnosus]CAF3509018.1 unnamed protein product [Didymodactylos carnosus]CAF3943828.1 unnamed protein product [Didymodactylos carnosus]